MATRWVGEWRWKVGTHGLFALEDPDQPDYSVRQAFMIYYYLEHAFGDQMIKTVSNNSKLWVYGSRFNDGKYGLMVINPTDSTQYFNLKSEIAGFEGKAWWYEVYANTVDEGDKKFYVNGFTSSTKGGGPDNYTSILPFESDVKTETKFKVRKFSVSFFVFRTGGEKAMLSAKDDYFQTTINQDLTASVATNDTTSKIGVNIFKIEQYPAHGTVEMQPSGDFIYMVQTNFNGMDSFTYSLCDANGNCDTANVLVEVKLPLALNPNREEKFRCYPNPVHNTTRVFGIQRGKQIELINLLGIVEKKVVVTNEPFSIDLSNLEQGLYILRSEKQIIRLIRK